MTMTYVPGLAAQTGEHAATWWFCFHQARLLLHGDGSVVRTATPATLGLTPTTVQCLGSLDGVPAFAAGFDDAPATLPADCRFVPLRELFGVLPDVLYAVATRALHLAQWDLAHRFCGRCGKPLALKSDERAKLCQACGQLQFPQIAPAVIVAVRREDQILLARSPRFPAGMFSVLAGFVEAGETLEGCAQREIHEETGIEIQNLCYFRSQPWPYPNSLMLGFTADYAGGEIHVDGVEITEAGWFRADSLPQLPGKLSIARALIDDFLRRTTG